MQTLNLGILAHVDAGKTTLTERLLQAAGLIDEIGSVDKGTTQTDSLELERQRGITIKSAVVSFVVDDVTVNLIDTPGHPDFIAEVERVLCVLDGAVLVISAVEGVQSQTRLLMKVLQRLRIPTLIFVNKIDRGGAQYEGVLQDIAKKLTPAIVPMGTAGGLGTRAAHFTLFDKSDPALAVETKQAGVHPVFFGSAITGAGVNQLFGNLTKFLPAADEVSDGPLSCTVFKVDRGPSREKIAYVRIFSGTLQTRDRLRFGNGEEQKVTAIRVFERGSDVQSPSVSAGQIAKLWGLHNIRIGDSVGDLPSTSADHYFAPPTLETVILPHDGSHKGALHVALSQLAEQDPLINVRQDDLRQELYVSLYGEVQKEVIQQTLASDFGLEVHFRETTMICVERPSGIGAAVDTLGKGSNPFLATAGFRIEPAPSNSGVEFRLDVELTSIPLYVFKSVDAFGEAMETTVKKTLNQGLYGWEVTDCKVTMTHSGYSSPGTSAKDFRLLTPLVLMNALKQAGTKVCEPIQRVHLEGPSDALGSSLSLLGRLQAIPGAPSVHEGSFTLHGEVRASRVNELQQQFHATTRGEGVLESAFSHYQQIVGPPPTRPRTDLNPLNRKEYLLHLGRRM
jgi:ribosomal protection tetracycline resistance protein